MKSKLIFLMAIVLISLSISSVCAENIDNKTMQAIDDFSSTNYVIGQLESDSGNGTGTFHDLQVEINNAPKGSVLNLTRDYKGAYGSSIQFNKDLTINGQGHTLDCLGERSCSAFYSNSGKITLKNLIIINGHDYFNDYGGAISIKGSAQYTIINCTFNNNWVKGFGGAIYNKANKPLTIINCTFNNNWANGFGGAIYNEVNKLPTIINCIFNNNTANRGGAICTKSNVKVDNSTFLNSHARDIGGAIYAEDSVNIEDSIFSGNTAYIDGGAIYNQKSVSVTNTLFKNNRAEGVMGTRCYGGAIRSKGDVVVNNSAFNDNHADYGGAIYADSVFINSASSFINNTVDGKDGGAIYAESSVKIVDSIFSLNSAYVDGGAIYAGGNVNIKNTTFDKNKAEGAKISQCYGGAIRSKGDVKIDNCSFLNNHAYDYGGAIYADSITWINSPSYFIGNYVNNKKGGAIYTNKFSTNVKYGVFINNTAKGKNDGGAIYINKKNQITFSQCVFVNNHCGDEGGAIYLDSSSSHLTLVNNIFISNSAKAGQTVYNCGKFDSIKNNWWGGNNPSSKNDQLIEWKAWPRSNVHHRDSAPLELHLKLSENTCKVNTSVRATAGFYNNDGRLCSGEMITDYISFPSISDIEFSNRTDDKSYVTTLLSPQKEGQYTITANLFNQLASDVLIAVNDSHNRHENTYNSANVMTNLPNDSLNAPVTNDHNIALYTTHVGVNNGNTNLLSANSNVKNTNYANTNINLESTSMIDTWYVNASAPSGGDGSKAKPFNTLNDALTVAQDGNTIMIASGEYKGTKNINLNITNDLNFIKYGAGEAIFNAEGLSRIWTVTATSINITGLTFKNGNADGESYYETCGGAILIRNAPNSNINATFINNTASFGGAIYIDGGVSSNLISTFINNIASGAGGAIYIDGDVSGNLISTFINNTAFFGGAIYIYKGDVSGNLNGIFINNTVIGGDGGAIIIDGGSISGNLTGSFINNTVEGDSTRGGAIYIDNTVFGNLNGTFINNKAGIGGAIYIDEGGISGNLTGSFINNTAIDEGGAIYIGLGDISGNLGGIFINNKGGTGGAIYIEDVLPNLNNSIFINNTAETYGGAIYVDSDISDNITGIFINNTASSGGAIHSNGVSGNIEGIFINNAADYGGAITVGHEGFFGNITGIFINNTANDVGGAIHIYIGEYDNITGNISGTFINNTANNNGGAIHIYVGEYSDISCNLMGKYINNKANAGGAIYIGGNQCGSDIIIRDSIFINNIKTFGVETKNITAIDCWFGNNATNYYIPPINIENATMDNWLFLNATANTTEIPIGQDSTITFKLDSHNRTSNTTSPYDALKMNVIIQLSQTLGELNQTVALIGKEVLYTAKQKGNASITGKFETAFYTINLTVYPKSDVVIVAENVTKYYGGPERFVANIYDSEGNPLVNKSVNITINGVTYTRTTDDNGTVSLAIRLGSGTYDVTTQVDNTTVKSSITVLSTVIGSDLTKYYKNKTQYSVQVYDTNGKAVGKGEVVTFNINGIFYNRTTDENGIATLNINLPPSEYIITSDYKGCKIANNIKVLPVLNASDITMKYLDGTQFKVNLVDGQGNPYKDQFVTFNVNGIFYNRLTDSNGQAALNIRLPPGEYIITSSFNGANIANKITITG